jgi:hypothetical protein
MDKSSNSVELGAAANRSRPTKRRSRAEIEILKSALYDLIAADRPCTVRQVFYRAVSAGLIAKTEAEYKQTITRLLGQMRLGGVLPFHWIADNTRWMRKPSTYSSLADMLRSQQHFYRRALWDDQQDYVEIWLEKDALSGVIYPVTAEHDVPLMVTRGYASLSYLHAAAEAISEQEKTAYLYYLGDWDPSGLDITRATEERLKEFAPNAKIFFERIAVTEQQIVTLQLPTRPTKQTDSRAGNFQGESVEVDAIPPAVLRELVRSAIQNHIDEGAFQRLEAVEAEEKTTLRRIARQLNRKTTDSTGARARGNVDFAAMPITPHPVPAPDSGEKPPTPAHPITLPGGPLKEEDYAMLAKSAISRELAEEAMLRHLAHFEGQIIFQRKRGNCDCVLLRQRPHFLEVGRGPRCTKLGIPKAGSGYFDSPEVIADAVLPPKAVKKHARCLGNVVLRGMLVASRGLSNGGLNDR